MTMISEYRQLTPGQLDRLLRNPDNVEAFIDEYDADEDFEDAYDEDDDGFEDEEPRGDDDDEDEEEEDEDEDEYGTSAVDHDGSSRLRFSLDKAWHALHFMLNDHPWEGSGPLFDAILGGTEIGEEDVGPHGPPRVLTPDEVRAVATALNKVNKVEFKKKFDPAAFKKNEVYLGDYEYRDLERALKDLTAFFEEAAESGNAMLLTLT